MSRSGIRWRDLANPAGALTLARLPLAALFPLFADRPVAAAGIYLVGLSTDVLDGWAARRSGTVSQAGALADGISDKIFHLTVAISVVTSGLVPWWWLPLSFTRELGQLVLAPWFTLRYHRAPTRSRHANRLGKLASTLLSAACMAAIVGWRPAAVVIGAVTGVVGLAATISYAHRETLTEDGENGDPPGVIDTGRCAGAPDASQS